MRLNTKIHDRDVAGMTYVYPVVSRRAGGVSVGINLNPNNACNWRCAYCQVEGLVRGSAPPIDLPLLEDELRGFMHELVRGDYMQRHVPEEARRINDIAFSGNGEPTTSKDLPAALDIVERTLRDLELEPPLKIVLITNGSLIHQPWVRESLKRLATMNGEVWFKLDSATTAGRERLNDTELGTERVQANLELSASLCRTRVQTCALVYDGAGPSVAEQTAYVELLERARANGAELHDVLLYGLERKSYQPEADRLAKLPVAELEAFAERIRASGLPVAVHP